MKEAPCRVLWQGMHQINPAGTDRSPITGANAREFHQIGALDTRAVREFTTSPYLVRRKFPPNLWI